MKFFKHSFNSSNASVYKTHKLTHQMFNISIQVSQWNSLTLMLQMSSIVFLERCMNTLLKQRTEKLIKRRQEDIKDQSVLFMAGQGVLPTRSVTFLSS